jgi:adenine phosphoribosyltransferase
MTAVAKRVQRTLRAIPDYPKPGILFQDITPVLRDGALLHDVVTEMARPFRSAGVTHVLGIEARGFILGGAVATALSAGFVPARKPGKLPWERASEAYDLEYGSDALEAHRDALSPGNRVLVVDDVLATGGTARAAGQLARSLGSELVGWSFLLEIEALKGRERLQGALCHVITGVG